jgi:hypothetical protein
MTRALSATVISGMIVVLVATAVPSAQERRPIGIAQGFDAYARASSMRSMTPSNVSKVSVAFAREPQLEAPRWVSSRCADLGPAPLTAATRRL